MAGGRPKQDTQQALTRHVGVRFSDAERTRLDDEAAALGVSVSDLIRGRALDAAKAPRRRRQAGAPPALAPEVIASLNALGLDLRAIGNNANQIARALNGGEVTDHADLARLSDDLASLRPQLEAVFGRLLA
jgi:hypothetical protein